MDKHFQAMKRKQGSMRWLDVSIYELLEAVKQATDCDGSEVWENVDWMLEDCIDISSNGFVYAVQEVL